MLMFVVAAFTIIAAFLRRPLYTALVCGGIVGAFFALAQWFHIGTFGPMGGISRIIGIDHVPFGVVDVRLWT